MRSHSDPAVPVAAPKRSSTTVSIGHDAPVRGRQHRFGFVVLGAQVGFALRVAEERGHGRRGERGQHPRLRGGPDPA